MMSAAREVYRALTASISLQQILHHDKYGRCIYHGRSPDAGSYPILVYNIISDVPVLMADGEELERRVTVRIHILTKDGCYERIEKEVVHIMRSIHYLRAQSIELIEHDCFIKVIDFKKGTGGI